MKDTVILIVIAVIAIAAITFTANRPVEIVPAQPAQSK